MITILVTKQGLIPPLYTIRAAIPQRSSDERLRISTNERCVKDFARNDKRDRSANVGVVRSCTAVAESIRTQSAVD